MSTWSTTTTLVPCEYKNLTGLPAQVEAEMQELLKQDGWYLNGCLLKISIDDTDVVVQSMVRYKNA